jgi:hypothetical protein
MSKTVSSEMSFEDLIAEAKRAFERIEESKVRIAAGQRQLLEKAAGNIISSLFVSRESAENYLGDSDSNKRIAALMVLLDHWRPNAQLAQTCEKIALTDSDAQVRGVALVGLGQCYADTRDARVLRLLAGIVGDEKQPSESRSSAYFALFQVDGVDAKSLPDPSFRFPDGVDWKLVSRLMPNAEVLPEVLT